MLSFFSAGFPGILLYIALAVLIPSGRTGSDRGYGHQNPYNRNVRNENPYAANKKQRKEAEKIDDDGFEFSFHTDKKAYIYEISERGKIEEISTSNYTTPKNDKTNENQQTQAPSADKEAAMLTQEQALEKAIAHFKVDAAAITNLQIYQEITSSDIDTIH